MPQEPNSSSDVICADFPRFGLMLVLNGNGTLRDPSFWTVYQQKHGHWRNVSGIDAVGKPGSVKVLENGDLLEDTGRGFVRQTRWDGRQLKVIAVRPPIDTSTCALRQAQEVATLDVAGWGLKAGDVICQDFSKYGLMMFFANPGAGDDRHIYIYRRRQNGWAHVQDFHFHGSRRFSVLADGDLLLSSLRYHALLHWTGQKFTRVRESRSYVFWNGAHFVLKDVTLKGWTESHKGCSFVAATKLVVNLFGRSAPLIGELTCADLAGSASPRTGPPHTEDFIMGFTLPRFSCDMCNNGYLFLNHRGKWYSLSASLGFDCIKPEDNGFVGVGGGDIGLYDKMAKDPACAPDANGCSIFEKLGFNGWTPKNVFKVTRRWYEKTNMSPGSCYNPVASTSSWWSQLSKNSVFDYPSR